MNNIDYKQFPPQQELQKYKGNADGNFFIGVCAILGTVNGVVVLVAHDVKTLNNAWNNIFDVALNRDGVQRVAIFSADEATISKEI